MKKVILALAFFTTTAQAMSPQECSQLALGMLNVAIYTTNASLTNAVLKKAIRKYPDYAEELAAHKVSEFIVSLNVGGALTANFTNKPVAAIALTANAIYALHNRTTKIHEAIDAIEKRPFHKELIRCVENNNRNK